MKENRVNLNLDSIPNQTVKGLDEAFTAAAKREGWAPLTINHVLMNLVNANKSFTYFKHQLKYFTTDTIFFGPEVIL